MADRNRYPRRGRYQDWNDRDDRSWREQEEQFSNERGGQPDYQEGYGSQMSEPFAGGYGQSQRNSESQWDRGSRYGQFGSGYSRGGSGSSYQSSGEYDYSPSRYETAPGWRGSSFTSEDQGGRDFNQPTRGFGSTGGYGGSYGATGGFFSSGGGLYEGGGGYRQSSRGDYRSSRDRGDDRNQRDWFDRAGDEVMSWFGDRDAARRRQQDHSGRGPQNYTRSDDRIREDVNDRLTDDWGVDASNVNVTVKGGEVTLDGTVATRLQKRRAEDCAEEVSGVKHVQNNLRVNEQSGFDRTGSGTTTSTSGASETMGTTKSTTTR